MILGVILAGGQARRMGGGDKTLMTLGGRTLLDRVVERIAPQCPAGLILSANGHPARFRFVGPVIADTVPGQAGPLAGVLAALETAAGIDRSITHVLSVPGDAPFLPHDLTDRLDAALEGGVRGIAHARSGGRAHYAAALWAVTLRSDLRAALGRDERRAGAFAAAHDAAVVDWPSEPVDPFLNLNEPADFKRAEAILAHPRARR